MKKVRLATVWLDGCSGCHMSFLDMDERLLKSLDKRPEVRKLGRSAVLREAVFEYLRSKRKKEIAEEYRRAYAAGPDPELARWGKQGVWLEE